eukprot:6326909-Prymnesium_polylepis.1
MKQHFSLGKWAVSGGHARPNRARHQYPRARRLCWCSKFPAKLLNGLWPIVRREAVSSATRALRCL